ncbi:MAG: glycoside hydrolase family 5 protein [Ignavibacteriaceae bacterium]
MVLYFSQFKKSFIITQLFLISVILNSCGDKSPVSPPVNTTTGLHALHAEGKNVVTADGKIILLTGVNIPSLEWSNAGENVLQSVQTAVQSWGVNIIRFPVCQDRWFGKANQQSDGGISYQSIVDQAIQKANGLGAYAALDLHWSDAGVWGQNIGQHKMPDMNSVTFWKDAATKYANNPGVIFDVYNEPHDVSWNIWKNGGQVSELINGINISYTAPGLQMLIDTIRAAGANNILIAGGLDWGYDLSGVLTGYMLNDPNGNGIIYGSHIYPWKGNSAADWNPHVGNIAVNYPVFIGEVGCQPDPSQEDPNIWAPAVLSYIQNLGLHWTGWSFHPSATPCLITDWNYTPTSYWGVYAKAALLSAKVKRGN